MNLKHFLENEYFIASQLLPTDRFIKFCTERGINISRGLLEQLEELQLFYPLARVSLPTYKNKVEYLDDGKRYRDLGILKDNENWQGNFIENYSDFWFEKTLALEWHEANLIFDPEQTPFESWDSFKDSSGREKVRSYYSQFQIYILNDFLHSISKSIPLDVLLEENHESILKALKISLEFNKGVVTWFKDPSTLENKIPIICQVISNRYYPQTQTDKRRIHISSSNGYHDWNWNEYCYNWNAEIVLKQLGLTVAELKELHNSMSTKASSIDPLEEWKPLVNFVSLEKRKRLKGDALLAQTFYSMEHMIRLFHEEITHEKLNPAGEPLNRVGSNIYGKDIEKDELKYLQYVVNDYHLNPNPKLILIVEGEGEYQAFPRLSQELLGYPFPRLGIKIFHTGGISGFTGTKKLDHYSAFERFIDYHHQNQTIVFIILDDEGRASQVRENLIRARSKLNPDRFLTNPTYVNLWDGKTIEFSNFTDEEIANAMTIISEKRYSFAASEIALCRHETSNQDKDTLSQLNKEKLAYGLEKPKLLKILFNNVLAHPENEHDASENPKRQVIKFLHDIIKLASKNHQPISSEIWRNNQDSGYFGGPWKS